MEKIKVQSFKYINDGSTSVCHEIVPVYVITSELTTHPLTIYLYPQIAFVMLPLETEEQRCTFGDEQIEMKDSFFVTISCNNLLLFSCSVKNIHMEATTNLFS